LTPPHRAGSKTRRRILIVCQLDRYANALKPLATKRFLEERGHDVSLVDTYSLARASSVGASLLEKLPAPKPARLLLYLVEAASFLARRSSFLRSRLSYFTLVADYRLRRKILGSALPLDDFDVVICETPHDAGVLTLPGSALKLYDCPTPWADELYYEGRLTEGQHRKLRRLEREVFESVDRLAFHWQTYAAYAVTHYGISGRNLMTLNFGCTPAPQRARFEYPLRIVYLGSLSSRFIDLPLLSRLSQLYPHIDVYGAPPPDPQFRLNYRGYAPPSVLREYQLGLVTCTQDELRREGFSAKHLEYLAFGLPVLVPAWRRHLDLIRGSVPYDESSFVQAIETLSEEEEWRRMSDEAYAQARRLAWEETLRPLDELLSDGPVGSSAAA
jgi:glycosyltransferase involved in cell wall biosynthesis